MRASYRPRSTRRTSARSPTESFAPAGRAGATPANDVALTLADFPRWLVFVSPPAAGADNMAVDHALLRRAAATGEAVLRIYSWLVPTLSLGRHQPARGLYDLAAIQIAGIDVVRRPTGGRAVLHHREVTYSVTAPLSIAGSRVGRVRTRGLYTAINRLLVDALWRLGVPASLAPAFAPLGDERSQRRSTPRAPRPTEHPCFDVATEGEVVVAGRKLAGSAQWRDPDAVLQHGSVLIADDQGLLPKLSVTPIPAVPVAVLGELLGRTPTVAEIAGVLQDALNETLERAGSGLATAYHHDEVTRAAAEGFRALYTNDAWTWRR